MQKSNLSPEAQQQKQEEMNMAKLDHQLKEIRQQCHTVFNATKQQLVQSDKGTQNISLENKTHHKWSKTLPSLSVIPLYLVLKKTEYRVNGEQSK